MIKKHSLVEKYIENRWGGERKINDAHRKQLTQKLNEKSMKNATQKTKKQNPTKDWRSIGET